MRTLLAALLCGAHILCAQTPSEKEKAQDECVALLKEQAADACAELKAETERLLNAKEDFAGARAKLKKWNECHSTPESKEKGREKLTAILRACHTSFGERLEAAYAREDAIERGLEVDLIRQSNYFSWLAAKAREATSKVPEVRRKVLERHVEAIITMQKQVKAARRALDAARTPLVAAKGLLGNFVILDCPKLAMTELFPKLETTLARIEKALCARAQ